MLDLTTTKASTIDRLENAARGLATCIFSATVAAYFGLSGVGQWQADEFADFAPGQHSLSALVERLTWSPRPLSEALLALYGWMTLAVRHPLTPVFLGVLWMGFVAAGVGRFAIEADAHRGQRDQGARTLVGLALLASFLTANRLTEVFYWPAGAVAYLPTLSASLFVFLQVAQGALESPKGRLRCGLALLCATLCSETGAFLAVAYAAVALVAAASGSAVKKSREQGPRRLAWVLWPGLCAAILLVVVRFHRFRVAESVSPEHAATVGHPAASVGAALSALVSSILGPGMQKHGLPILNLEFVSIALLAVGVGLCWTRREPLPAQRQRDLVCLAIALLLGALFMLTASYVHLGLVGERHDVMMRCWVRLAAGSAAIAALSSRQWQQLHKWRMLQAGAAVILMGGVVATWHVSPLVREYRAYRKIHSTIQANFRSGFAAGSNTIEWTLTPNRGVITAATMDPGTYDRASATGYPKYILEYFDKQVLIVRRLADNAEE